MINLSYADLVLLFVAFLVMVAGAIALLARLLFVERALGWFGLFSLLYGARVAISVPAVRAIAGLSPGTMAATGIDITYVLALPLMLLVEQFVGRGWHDSMRAAVWIQALYSIAGVGGDAITGVHGLMMPVKPYIILALGATALANILTAARRTAGVPRSLAAGFIAFLATVGVFNAGQILHRSISARVEVAGFVALVACLAYAVATRAVETETRLFSIEREIQTAQRIQGSILPQEPPAVRGLAICVRYRPMAAMAGDFYDFVPIEGGRAGVLIADVSGHGLPASLIASMVKVAVTAETPHASAPGALLTAVNHTLVGLLAGDREYVTACYLVVDPAARVLRYARAGHPPPLVRSPAGEVSVLDEGGTILGKFADVRYIAANRRVVEGSRVLLYTDGVTEAVSPSGAFFGLDQLETFLARNDHATASEFADALLERIGEWCGAAGQADDVTIIVVDIDRTGDR